MKREWAMLNADLHVSTYRQPSQGLTAPTWNTNTGFGRHDFRTCFARYVQTCHDCFGFVHGLYLGSCVCEKVARWFGIPVSSNGPLKKPASLSYVTVHLWSR